MDGVLVVGQLAGQTGTGFGPARGGGFINYASCGVGTGSFCPFLFFVSGRGFNILLGTLGRPVHKGEDGKRGCGWLDARLPSRPWKV